MRFLGIGESHDLGAMYQRLQAAGHEVRVYVANAVYHEKMKGIVPRIENWEAELSWIRKAGAEGFIIFETTTAGDVQDRLRRDGYNVIGSCSFGDRLENDRAFGQHWMRKIGLQTAPVREFVDSAEAENFLSRNPRRYVLKPNGAHLEDQESYVGVFEDASDLRLILRRGRSLPSKAHGGFVLMDHLEGVEVGVGAYFNGEQFMDPVCIDWEHKRFFDGDKGELTGEMGTLASYRNSGPLFRETLGRMGEALRLSNYVGYINLNTIVNDEGIWPLEFTCRFGYPGFAILDPLHGEGWADLFDRMISRRRLDFRTLPGFAVGAVLTIPPFPATPNSDRASGWPIQFRRQLSDEDHRNVHLDEVCKVDGQLFTTGPTGYVMVVTGTGDCVEQAQARAYQLIAGIIVPNGRYRSDIGARFLASDRASLQKWKLWPHPE